MMILGTKRLLCLQICWYKDVCCKQKFEETWTYITIIIIIIIVIIVIVADDDKQ